MTDELPTLDEDTVAVDHIGDYAIKLDIDGLPNGTVDIDYFDTEDNNSPRLFIRANDISVDLVHEDSGENVYAVSVLETSDLVDAKTSDAC